MSGSDDANTGPIKTGVLFWNQYTDWPQLRAGAQRADALGYDSLWTWDHLYPILAHHEGPFFEGYSLLSAWSQVTAGPSLGLMVGANTFRNPALVVKTVTTLDHLSDGRAVLGIGAAWFEAEHTAFGLEFGRSVGERLDWLDEAVEVMHGMLRGPSASARGDHYAMVDVRNDPRPVQSHLPILIGGKGERKTLRTVARFADAWNVAQVTADEAAHLVDVLKRWCDEFDRDPAEIERTLSLGPVVIRDDPAEATRVIESFKERNPAFSRSVLSGSAEEIAVEVRSYAANGFDHFIIHSPAPNDDETLERFVSEVKPASVV